MGWVDVLRGSVVGLDTAPLIYFTEGHPQYVNIINPFFQAIKRGEFTVVTSMITLLEVLVLPLRNNDTESIKKYNELLFEMKGIRTIDISQEILVVAAQIRAAHLKVRTPDAIHLATAIEAKASFFLTNDVNLPDFPGIQTLVLNKLNS
jgi:predicted nucleic acid-binding protein